MKNNRVSLRLLAAAFIFGAAVGFLGSLWQQIAQKSQRGALELKDEGAEAPERR
nr:MAG TPA: Lipopolysaccharide assembly protein A domain [Caudoviricetes sp.]